MTTGPLTARQCEILETAARYGGIGPAAARLGVSRQTAKNELRTIHAKLGVHTTLQSYHLASRRGYLTAAAGHGYPDKELGDLVGHVAEIVALAWDRGYRAAELPARPKSASRS